MSRDKRKKTRRMPGSGGPSLSNKRGGRASAAKPKTNPAKSATKTTATTSTAKRRKTGKKRSTSRRTRFFGWLKRLLVSRSFYAMLGSIGLTLLIFGLFTLIYFAHDLPDISELDAPRETIGIQIVSADGELIRGFGHIYGDYISYDELPQTLIDAVIATEDRNFFSHLGLDPWGIARAMYVNLKEGSFVQGGSTITQQLAKNVFLTPERTLERKVQEMLLAFWLESRFSKKEILSIYLNRVYLGAGNYGIDAAARHYFDKSARDLTLAESAMMAGLLKAPSRYAPTSNLELSKKRARQVLLNMVNAERLSQEEADTAFDTFSLPDRLINGTGSRLGYYFADWVVDQLPEILPNLEEDIIIETTFNMEMQSEAEAALRTILTEEVSKQRKVEQGALLAMRPDGAVVAMVGGKNYRKSQYNRATQAKRQPGSAFKMLVYLAAMEAGYRPEQMIEDRPIMVETLQGPWKPGNYTGKYLGLITIKEGLIRSINTIAVQLSQAVGIDTVVRTARRLGIRSELSKAPSIALGAEEVSLIEMTTAYAHLASGGKGVRPYGIREIRAKKDDAVLFRRRDVGDYIVIRRDVVAMMNDMLTDVVALGTGRGAAFGRPAAGKTGTTSDYKDAWFIGYTPNLVAGVWVGNDNAQPTAKVTGGSIPAKIWRSFMQSALQDESVMTIEQEYDLEPEPLPWQQQRRSGDIRDRSRGLPPRRRDSGPGIDFELGDEFWEKLMDGSVEHEYPHQRRRR